MLSQERINRVKVDYTKIAGEEIEVEVIGGAIYVFGSELATLRLFRAMPNMRQGFSDNRWQYYFSVELGE